MLIFWEQRLAILATPKTGSTAIEVALSPLAAISVERPPALKHTTAFRFQRFLRPWLERSAGAPFTVAALMREPLDWLGSWYRYRQREDIDGDPNSTAGLDFEAFVEGYLADPRPAWADVGSQARFLEGKDGRGVDALFRYEAIEGFVAFLEDRLGCAIELPRVNVSPARPLGLSEGVRARLTARLADDYALYRRIADQGPPRP